MRRADNLHVPIVSKSGSLKLLEPSGPVQTCNGIASPYIYIYIYIYKFTGFHGVYYSTGILVGFLHREVQWNFTDVSEERNAPILTLRRLTSYIYGAPILDVSRSHTTTQHSR